MKRMTISLIGLLLCLVAANSYAADQTSLFFKRDELQTINANLRTVPMPRPAPSPDLIHLGAVFYYGPENWTLWLQGERWTPATNHPDLHIIAVMPEQVRLSLTATGGATNHEITLRPYQSYNKVTGMVVEGDR